MVASKLQGGAALILGLSALAVGAEQVTPALVAPPAVVDAPRRGVQAGGNSHSALLPSLYELDAQPIEQITWITQGRCEVYSQGKEFVLTAGRVLIIPPNTPHEFVCTEDTIDIDFFAPQRQDWIDGAPSVASKEK